MVATLKQNQVDIKIMHRTLMNDKEQKFSRLSFLIVNEVKPITFDET